MGDYCQAEKNYNLTINQSQELTVVYNQRDKYLLHCNVPRRLSQSQRIHSTTFIDLNQGIDFGQCFYLVVRILAELEWGTEKNIQADKWLIELQEMNVTENIDRINIEPV